jgi:hypothetical protein
MIVDLGPFLDTILTRLGKYNEELTTYVPSSTTIKSPAFAVRMAESRVHGSCWRIPSVIYYYIE